MPTFTSSALNPNGSYQADGMDAADQTRYQMGSQRAQQALMAQLALAQLRSSDNQFAAQRQDNMGLAGINALVANNGQNLNHQDRLAELQSQNQATQAQFGFLGKQADQQNNQWQQGMDWQKQMYNVGAQPRQVQAQLAAAQLRDLLSRQQRSQAAQTGGVPYAPKTEAGRIAAQSAGLAGSGIGEQGLAAKSADMPELRRSADEFGTSVKKDLGNLKSKADSWNPRRSIDSSEITGAETELAQLQQRYVDSGMSREDAKLKAQDALREALPLDKRSTVLFGENPTDALYKALGLQGY